jgi:hypothetical protein
MSYFICVLLECATRIVFLTLHFLTYDAVCSSEAITPPDKPSSQGVYIYLGPRLEDRLLAQIHPKRGSQLRPALQSTWWGRCPSGCGCGDLRRDPKHTRIHSQVDEVFYLAGLLLYPFLWGSPCVSDTPTHLESPKHAQPVTAVLSLSIRSIPESFGQVAVAWCVSAAPW